MDTTLLKQFLEIPLFIFSVAFYFYFPGRLVLSRLNLKTDAVFGQSFLSIVLGLVLFTLFSYILSWIKLDFVLIPISLIIFLFSIRSWKIPQLHKPSKEIFSVLIMSAIFSSCMLVTGLYGKYFVFRQDDLWHLALINELKTNFPPNHPGFSGLALHDYHFFYNFLLAEMSKFSWISPVSLHFHFIPVLFALLWGFGVYELLFSWSKRKDVGLWGVFLTMFGGSFGFFLFIERHIPFSLDNGFGMWQPTSWLYNPPLSSSLILVLGALFCFFFYYKHKNWKWLIPMALMIGISPMFKVYGGIVLFAGFAFFSFLEILRGKIYFLIPATITALIFVGTYGIFVGGSGKLIFYPLWQPHSVLQGFSSYNYIEKHYTYYRLGVIRKILQLELYGLYLFIVGNLGTRLIGLIGSLFLFFNNKKISSFTLIIGFMAFTALLIPLLFIQSIKVFEITQMDSYFLFLSAVLASFGIVFITDLIKARPLKYLFILFFIILTLPSALQSFQGFYDVAHRGILVNNPVLQPFTFLAKDSNYNAIVLELPSKNVDPSEKSILDWYRGKTSPAISALGNKSTFFDYEYIDFPESNFLPRVKLLSDIQLLRDQSTTSADKQILSARINKELLENRITYIYVSDSFPEVSEMKNYKNVFHNSSATIYQLK